MGLFDKYRLKKAGNGRYFEKDGLRFAIGIDFVINMTKEYNRLNSCNATIDEAIAKCLGQEKLTVDSIELIQLAVLCSLNTQFDADSKDKVNIDFVKDLFNKKGFVYVGEILLNLRLSVVSLLKGDEALELDENQVKKKG